MLINLILPASIEDWPYPGSRWWKFDFHTHTPASRDTDAWQRAINTPDEVTPERWLLRYMDANMDCVAVTDHNSGGWIDKLKSAYETMHAQAEIGNAPAGFRELTLFPGVEISVQGGFHLLAIFDGSATTRTITDLLAVVGYQGTDGDSDGVTRMGAADVVRKVFEAGGIPIPAHADRLGDSGKALLAVREGSRECRLDANTVIQVIDTEGLLALEWENMNSPLPSCAEKRAGKLARVLGSDCHSFQGKTPLGSRYTWIKMAQPTLDGLRLALLDGNGISIRRSDEGAFAPFKTPAHFITCIEIESARFMGNGSAERLLLTPYYNALIGGRGTGKSTIVHALRLAFRRNEDLKRLSDRSETRRQFDQFTKVARVRDGEGGLRENTEIRIELMREGKRYRLRWRQDSQGMVVEACDDDGLWEKSVSQTINDERFPVRLFSQGQIAAMAGDGRQALLDVIDETAHMGALHRAHDEAKRTYLAQCAKLREINGQLAGRPELERKLVDLVRTLETFTQSHHAVVLSAHQKALRQRREIEGVLAQLQTIPGRIEMLAQDLLLDDWPMGVFDPIKDMDALAWRPDAEQVLAEARERLKNAAGMLAAQVQALATDGRITQWRQRAEQAQADYDALQGMLADQGVTDPQVFGRLVQERQQIESQLKRLDQLQQDMTRLQVDSNTQWQLVLTSRKAITQARSEFVVDTLQGNAFVRMEVAFLGFDSYAIERSLREILDVQDDRFELDILHLNNGEPAAGLAFELTQDADREEALERIKQCLISNNESLGGHFRNYLQRKLEKPEFTDHIRCWFPEDDLRIEYSRGGNGRDWMAITQGSQGQRSAALLAFLLALGEEPLVLDQPEDDLDNHLIYDLIVRQIRENKLSRQLIIVTHNPNVVVNGDAEMVHAFDFRNGQCCVVQRGALQDRSMREEVCRIMEGGREAFAHRWVRLGEGG